MKKIELYSLFFWVFLLSTSLIFSSCADRFRLDPIQFESTEILTEDKSEQYLSLIDHKNEEYFVQLLIVKRKDDWQQLAPSDLEGIFPMHKSNLDICLLLMEYYLDIQDFTTAGELADQAEVLGAKNAKYFLNKAILYSALNQHDRAIDNINKALLLNASDYTIYLEKGNIYLSYGDTISAIQFISKAFGHNRKQLDVLYQLSTLYLLTHQNDQALIFVNEALVTDPDNEKILFLKAKVQQEQLDQQGLMQTYKYLLLLENADAGLAIADIFYLQEKYDSTIYYADKILHFDSLNIGALMAKGNAFDSKGYFSSALFNYEEILAIDPSIEEAVDAVKKVNGKIAYLRKLRKERDAIPTFDFAVPRKKKTINNE